MVGDRGDGQDSVSCDRIRGRGFVWALMGSHIMFLHVLHPAPTQIMPPISNHHHLCTPRRASGSYTGSFCSCHGKIGVGTRSPLSSCTRGSRGDYSCPYDTPLPTVRGIKRVYKCWVEGCTEGLSTSHATICAHVHREHLGVWLACPSCNKTFFNLDTLRHHKKHHL